MGLMPDDFTPHRVGEGTLLHPGAELHRCPYPDGVVTKRNAVWLCDCGQLWINRPMFGNCCEWRRADRNEEDLKARTIRDFYAGGGR